MSSSVSYFKKGYSWGYVVFPEGDTPEGWVKDRSTGTFLDLYAQIYEVYDFYLDRCIDP